MDKDEDWKKLKIGRNWILDKVEKLDEIERFDKMNKWKIE